jgi:hypothetical protein
MFCFQRLSFVIGCSLLILPAFLANQASAQTVVLTSLESADCSNNASTKTECTSKTQGVEAAQPSGTTPSLASSTEPFSTALQSNNQGSFLVGTNPFDGLFKTDGISAVASSQGTTGPFSTGDRDKNKSRPNRISDRIDRSLVNSRLMQLPIGREILPNTSAPSPGNGAIAQLSTGSKDGILPNSLTQPTGGTLPNSLTQPTRGILPNSLTQPTGGTFPNSPTGSSGGIFPTPSVGSTDGKALSNPSQLATSDLIADTATVPEPSISLLAWLGLAAVGLLPTRFKSKL